MSIIIMFLGAIVTVLGVILQLRKKKLLGWGIVVLGLLSLLSVMFFHNEQPFGPGMSDFQYDVAGNYIIVSTSAHQVSVIPKDGRLNGDTPIIPAKVVKIVWDNRFILAEQQGLKRRSANNPNDTYMLPDNKVINYWILDTSIPKCYGPFKKEEFDLQIDKLRISKSLVLKDVNSYVK